MADFNRAPYYDDFEENKKFLKILFQPGRPVQARELTQLQSILQHQISIGAQHIFQNGSKVFERDVDGAQQTFDINTARHIKLKPFDKNGRRVDVDNWIGQQVQPVGQTIGRPGSVGIVLHATANVDGDPATLYIQMLQGSVFQSGVEIKTIGQTGYYTANVTSFGPCSLFSVNEGVYFVNGRYVKADSQTIAIGRKGKYSANVTYRIGFDVITESVSSADDPTLLDPASGFSNHSGAGADREKVTLVLNTRGDGESITTYASSNTLSSYSAGDLLTTPSFFEIQRVERGVITRVSKTPFYSELEKALARRTFDQSGNFTVKPFTTAPRFKNRLGLGEGEDKIILPISGGKAYIEGYEFDNEGLITNVELRKGRDIGMDSISVPVLYGNYALIHDSQNTATSEIVQANGVFNTFKQDRIAFFSTDKSITNSPLGADSSGATSLVEGAPFNTANIFNSILVGSARAESFIFDSVATKKSRAAGFPGNSYRLYFYDFQSNYITGRANGTSAVSVNAAFHQVNSPGLNNPHATLGGGVATHPGPGLHLDYYRINTHSSAVRMSGDDTLASVGNYGLGAHGLDSGKSNTEGHWTDDQTLGFDYVDIQGFNDGDGNPASQWNQRRAKVLEANNEWIGVRSGPNSSNNYGLTPWVKGANENSNTVMLYRTTHKGINPRRLIMLDANTRAFWSDAYNGSLITITSGPAAGDRRIIIDYVGGNSSASVNDIQGGVDDKTGENPLDGTTVRGLAVVDREFSVPITRESQYRIDFGLKHARSVGINANTVANGNYTSDMRYFANLGLDVSGTGGAGGESIAYRASPNFTTMWNIDAVSGISPVGSITESAGVYRGTREPGSTIYNAQKGHLLGATARQAVKSLRTHESKTATNWPFYQANTTFITHRTWTGLTGRVQGTATEIDLGQALWVHPDTGTKFYGYNSITATDIILDDATVKRFYTFVDETTGRIVDMTNGEVKILAATGATDGYGRKMTFKIPPGTAGASSMAEGYTDNGPYTVIATLVHSNIAPKKKTLVRANTTYAAYVVVNDATDPLNDGSIGSAGLVISRHGLNFSNGQVLISDSSGNNKVTDTPTNRVTGGRDSLGISDVYRVVVVDSGDLDTVVDKDMIRYAANNNVSKLKILGGRIITNNYILDSGQRAHIYDHGTLILKPGCSGPQGQAVALVDYFSHPHSSVDQPSYPPSYFSVDSYQTTEDVTFTTEPTWSIGERVEGKTSGVKATVADIPATAAYTSGLKISFDNLTSRPDTVNTSGYFFADEHFLGGESVVSTNNISKIYTVSSIDALFELDYKSIPKFAGPSRIYSLRDVVDYRPRKHDGNTAINVTANNNAVPLDSSAFNISSYPLAAPSYTLKYYQGRVDLVVLHKNRNILVKEGTSSLIPRIPNRPSNSMTLFKITVPPYTFSPSHVLVEYVSHRRYTMKDISGIDKRIRNLEYYVALNALERMAKDEPILDKDGLDRFKNGILTDNFSSFRVVRRAEGETIKTLTEYPFKEAFYSLDTNKGLLQPAITGNSATSMPFAYNSGDSGAITQTGINGRVLMLPYEEVIWTDGPQQLMITESSEFDPEDGAIVPDGPGNGKIPVNPEGVTYWKGMLQIDPDIDNFIDTGAIGQPILTTLADGATAFDNMTPDELESAIQDGATTQAALGAPDIVGEKRTQDWLLDTGSDSGTVTDTYEGPESTQADTQVTVAGHSDWWDSFHSTDTEGYSFVFDVAEKMTRAYARTVTSFSDTLSSPTGSIQRLDIATTMRGRAINVVATGMKPASRIHAHFASEPVSQFIAGADQIRFSGNRPHSLGQTGGAFDYATAVGSLLNLDSGTSIIQEDVYLKGPAGNIYPNYKAKLVARRGNTAYISQIDYRDDAGNIVDGPFVKFSDDGVIVVGNTTGNQARTHQFNEGSAAVSPGFSYTHRSGFCRSSGIVYNADGANTSAIGLSVDAPAVAGALAMPGVFDGNPDSDQGIEPGVFSTPVTIVSGRAAGQKGLIYNYDAVNKVAYVDWYAKGYGPRGSRGTLISRMPPSSRESAIQRGVIQTPSTSGEDRSVYALTVEEDGIAKSGDLNTNDWGEFFGTLYLPGGTFKTGKALLRLTDRGDGNPIFAKTWAKALYNSTGVVETTHKQYVVTRSGDADYLGQTDVDYGIKILDNATIHVTDPNNIGGNLWICTGIDIKNWGGTYTEPRSQYNTREYVYGDARAAGYGPGHYSVQTDDSDASLQRSWFYAPDGETGIHREWPNPKRGLPGDATYLLGTQKTSTHWPTHFAFICGATSSTNFHLRPMNDASWAWDSAEDADINAPMMGTISGGYADPDKPGAYIYTPIPIKFPSQTNVYDAVHVQNGEPLGRLINPPHYADGTAIRAQNEYVDVEYNDLAEVWKQFYLSQVQGGRGTKSDLGGEYLQINGENMYFGNEIGLANQNRLDAEGTEDVDTGDAAKKSRWYDNNFRRIQPSNRGHQAERYVSHLRGRRAGQYHTLPTELHDPGEIDAMENKNINVIKDPWDLTPGTNIIYKAGPANHMFPSLRVAGEFDGVQAFAVVQDGHIIDTVITDCGGASDAAGEPAAPVVYAYYHGHANQLHNFDTAPADWQGVKSPQAFLGIGEITNDKDTILAKVPYIREAIEAQRQDSSNILNQDQGGQTIAQSFTVKKSQNPNGVFITGVDLWFAGNPSGQGTIVTVEIRALKNGYPDAAPLYCVGGANKARATSDVRDLNFTEGTYGRENNDLPEGVRTRLARRAEAYWSHYSGIRSSNIPDANDTSSYSTFYFDAPVHLDGGQEYCIVVHSNGREYYLWGADMRGNILGSYIMGQPASVEAGKAGDHFNGTLYQSQGVGAWYPDSHKDIAFRFRRCKFTQNETEVVIRAGHNYTRPAIDSFTGQMATIATYDGVLEQDLDFDSFNFRSAQALPGGREPGMTEAQLTEINYEYVSISADDDEIEGAYTAFEPGSTVKLSSPLRLKAGMKGDNGSFKVRATLKNNNPSQNKVSPVLDISDGCTDLIVDQLNINSGGFTNAHVSFPSGPLGGAYDKDDKWVLIDPTSLDEDGNSTKPSTELAYVKPFVSGGVVQSVYIDPETNSGGKDYSVTPIVQESSITGLGVTVDDIVIEGETGISGGNAKFRYVTKPVKLKKGLDASDLHVTIDAFKPQGSKIYVYYKVKNNDDPETLDSKKWVKMNQASPSNDGDTLFNVEKPRYNENVGGSDIFEMIYNTGSNNRIEYRDTMDIHYDTFREFAIKIVGFADSSSNPPIIHNLRAIAVT